MNYLRRFTDVCNAVAYAHSRGVLHRDLKPGNIMLGPYGETLVVDWGLAKSVGDALSGEGASGDGSSLLEGPIQLSGQSGSGAETVAGSPIGTPAYASPEQVTGAMHRMGPATDIYGLGATLYALLTGHPPVESSDLAEVIRRVERGDIPLPRSIEPTMPNLWRRFAGRRWRPIPRIATSRAGAGDGRDEVARRRAGDCLSGPDPSPGGSVGAAASNARDKHGSGAPVRCFRVGCFYDGPGGEESGARCQEPGDFRPAVASRGTRGRWRSTR